MFAELTSLFPVGWHPVRLGLAALCGALVTALPAVILLVRARRRHTRLRRQLARLTTSTALLTGTGRNGQPRRIGAEHEPDTEPAEKPPAQHAETPPRKPGPGGSPPPAPRDPVEQETVPDALRSPAPQADPAGAESGGAIGGEHPIGRDGAQHPTGDEARFGSQEIAERFRREYAAAMDDSRQRLEELRTRLTGELGARGTEQSNDDQRPTT
ncbi:hypothetical protein [Actinopolyspora mortivallis]|uniref:hypothetical protein n=1 Tax=Actinopolyspora mortivallis TaxID=33906 RepID=UPI0012EDE3AD|nr:hypothetical protein [Actinopolyspora mortivallis]